MSPKPKGSTWNGDAASAIKLAAAKKAAIKAEPKKESWWADANLSREEFRKRVDQRHAEILNSASNATRSINRAI